CGIGQRHGPAHEGSSSIPRRRLEDIRPPIRAAGSSRVGTGHRFEMVGRADPTGKLFVMSQLIISALGPDRPGIVGELTGHLHSAGCNLLDSRMINLRGEFAMMILLECPDASASKLRQDLPAVGTRMGLSLDVTAQESVAKAQPG